MMRNLFSRSCTLLRRLRAARLLMIAVAGILLGCSVVARADVIQNDLMSLGWDTQNRNNLKQIGIGLHQNGGTYLAGDGSVRFIPGDGSVRYISVGPDVNAVLCFHSVHTTGDIRDGTSNTIVFGESGGVSFIGGAVTGLAPNIRDFVDGTSNTITFPELPLTNFCIDNSTNLDPVTGSDIHDGTSNTITFGENSSLDLCFNRALLPTIEDGSSNTILIGEVRNNVCFNNVVASPDLTVAPAVPEPSPLALVAVPLAALALRRRRAR